MFELSTYLNMYRKFLGPLAPAITLAVKDGSGYTYYQTTGHVSKYQEKDLVSGGSIQLGDLKIIILKENLDTFGIEEMGLSDRININGRTYAVIHWDAYTRSVGGTTVAVEATIRGGGLATII